MFERSPAVATDVLFRRLRKLRAVLASFDDEILLCECGSGVITCDGPSAEPEAPLTRDRR
jgi:hypothetical protein